MMKQDVNDASSDRDYGISPYLSLILVFSRTSVCQPCCLLPAALTLASLLGNRHCFGSKLQNDEHYFTPWGIADS